MKDLSRLLDSTDDELALSLLHSAHEEPPPEALTKLAAALGVTSTFALSGVAGSSLLGAHAQAAALPPGAAAVAPAASASAPWFLLTVAKPLAIGLVGGLAALGGINYATAPAEHAPNVRKAEVTRASAAAAPVSRRVQALHGSEPERADSEVVEPTTPAKLEAKAVHGVAAAPLSRARHVDVAPAGASVAAQVNELPAAANAPAQPIALPPESARSTPSDEALAKELRMLAQARSSLVAGDAPAALRILDQYSAERRGGALEPEASMLRIQALQRLGDRQGAARFARAFLAAHPERAHDESLRSIAGEAP